MNFRPLNTQNSQLQNYGQINDMMRQLNNEQTTKAFKQPGGNAIVTGRLPDSLGYGTILYDSSSNPLIYMAVDDGQPIFKIAKPGKNAITGDNEDLIFNSANNVFKILATDTSTVPSIAAAPSSSSFTISSATINTGVSTTEPLAFLVYGKIIGGSTYRQLPFHQVFTDGAQGARIGTEWEATCSVIAGEAVLSVDGRNYQNALIDELEVRWYILQETIATA